MSTVDVLEIPIQMGLTELASSTLAPLPSNKTTIVVEDQVFEIENSPIASPVLEKLRRMEDGSYRFPDEWNVHAGQFATLFDLLRFPK